MFNLMYWLVVFSARSCSGSRCFPLGQSLLMAAKSCVPVLRIRRLISLFLAVDNRDSQMYDKSDIDSQKCDFFVPPVKNHRFS
ncbi:hypothetical protein BDP81DRAFT_423537 [Colletotrichum phormii]|uniref:Secreted protein n=1 Tax=Colletotrichum phormii TaxID=359342 RepID=A0AAI9ZWG1_9PEZI|nr:uncharacterized protein BDP81DRAFT_423537 [Colletotrichum phormii]KAK1639141.1 hypothetical protein BDP81DRAFT_423537 [Colletotrichum phormii]